MNELLDVLREFDALRDGDAGNDVVHQRSLSAIAPTYADVSVFDGLAPPTAEALRRCGIDRLYQHQADAISHARDGSNVVPPFYPESQGVKRIMRPAPRSEPVAVPEKFRLVNRRQDDSHYRLLDDLVFQGDNAERSCPTVRFGYCNPSRRQRPIRSRMYASVQVEQSPFQSVLVLPPHQTIHASRCGLLQVVEGAP